MAKKIDLGVSRGPSAAERATIRGGNKKVESTPIADAPEKDAADVAADAEIVRRRSNVVRAREAQNSVALPGGKNSKAIDENTGAPVFTKPHMDSSDPHVKALATHSDNFIKSVQSGDRAKANAARAAFHATSASKRGGAPKGLEIPCSGGDCKNTNYGRTSCSGAGGSCEPMGGSVNVQRPRG
jgi:hypothetical protein